jgi:hypothetical protein
VHRIVSRDKLAAIPVKKQGKGSGLSTGPKYPLRGLLISQFFGAFNDNAWKIIVIELAVEASMTSERLAVLHTIEESRIPEILEELSESGLPDLFIPRIDQFVKVDALPLLGTGKLDLREIKRMATASLNVGT